MALRKLRGKLIRGERGNRTLDAIVTASGAAFTKASLSAWELDKWEPRDENILALCSALGCTYEQISKKVTPPSKRITIFNDEYLRENCIWLNNVKLGADVKIYSFVNAYGCEIGDETRIGAFVEIQKGVKIGRRCKISSHSFLCEGLTIEDNVFIGHGVMFTNDKYPRATGADGSPQSETDWTVVPITVEEGASVGSNATILAGVTIGKRSIVGAGAVVTKDVPPDAVVAGVPARVLRTA